MLVLSRKQAESVSINGNVLVTVLRIRGGKVRLGIEAPADTPVHRGEVYERIKDQRSSLGRSILVEALPSSKTGQPGTHLVTVNPASGTH